MSSPKTRLMNTQDRAIYRTLLGFLSAPLVLMMGAAMLIAV